MPPETPANDAVEAPQTSPAELDTSTAHATDTDVTPSASSTEDTGNVTPDAADSNEPKSLEDAVRRALDGPPDAKAGSDADDDDAGSVADANPDTAKSPGEAKASDTTTDAKGDDDVADDYEPSAEELKSYRPQVQKRIKKLVDQRNHARREMASIRPAADQYQAIRSFMAKNDLTDAEVADLFRAGADLKAGTPERLQAFLERVTPMVQMAREVLGQAIPADLQEQVDAGEMTDQAAREFAKTRRQAELTQSRLQRQQEQQQGQQQAQAQLMRQASVTQALQSWTTQKAASDPDFARKQDAMKVIAQGLVAERGLPKTPEDAVRYAEDAYRLVGGVSAPARQPTRPSPSTSASVSRAGVTPAPNSLADIVKQGLRHTG